MTDVDKINYTLLWPVKSARSCLHGRHGQSEGPGTSTVTSGTDIMVTLRSLGIFGVHNTATISKKLRNFQAKLQTAQIQQLESIKAISEIVKFIMKMSLTVLLSFLPNITTRTSEFSIKPTTKMQM